MRKKSTGAARQRLGLLRAKAKSTATQVGPNPYREGATKKAIVLTVTACALCGPIALLFGGSGGTNAAGAAPETSSAPVDSTAVGEQVRAAGVARVFLSQYLVATSATQQQLLAQVQNPPATLTLPQKAPAAPTSMMLVDATRTTPGTWLISYAVAGGASGSGETYQVPVQQTTSGITILALPSRVGSIPAAAPKPEVLSPLGITSAAGQASSGFLRSWLTNGDDITRWTSVQFTPAPVTGQLCRAVTLTGLAAGSRDADALSAVAAPTQSSPAASSGPSSSPTPSAAAGQVLATATCATATTSRQLSYRLTLVEVAGQLVVSAVNPYQS